MSWLLIWAVEVLTALGERLHRQRAFLPKPLEFKPEKVPLPPLSERQLIRQLDAPDRRFRAQALAALGTVGGDAAVPPIKQLAGWDVALRADAELSLRAIRARRVAQRAGALSLAPVGELTLAEEPGGLSLPDRPR